MHSWGWLVVLLAHGAPAVAAAPSFDCGRAGSWVERTVCEDDELATLDRTMAEAFSARRSELGDVGRGQVLDDQRRWLAERAECRSDIDGTRCLIERYRTRIAALGGIVPARDEPAPESPRTADRGAIAECRSEATDAVGVGLCLDRKLAEATGAFGDAEAAMLRDLEKDAAALEAFRSSQEAFLRFRDATCRWRSTLAGGGDPDLRQGCLVDYTRARTAEIEGLVR